MTQPRGPSAFDLITAELEGAMAQVRSFMQTDPPAFNDALRECAAVLDRFPDEPVPQLYWASLVMEADLPWDEARRQVGQSIAALRDSRQQPSLLPMTDEKIVRRFRSTLNRCTAREWYVEREQLLDVALFHNPQEPQLLKMDEAQRYFKAKRRSRNRSGRNRPRLEP